MGKTPLKQTIWFEGHQGILCTRTGKVKFYKLTFDNMCKAVHLLRECDSKEEYITLHSRKINGLMAKDTGEVILNTEPHITFCPDKETAQQFCRSLKKLNLRII
jgi:hypothetical protein